MAENRILTSAAMDGLRRKYAERLRERETQIQTLINLGSAGPLSSDARMALQTQAHNLAGSGATYGYPDISKAGRTLEESIENGAEESIFLPLARKLIDICRSVSSTQAPPPNLDGLTIISNKQDERKNRKKLLVVDDDHSVHELISEMFKKEVELLTALDGTSGMEIIRSQKPDLVLLDGTLGLPLLESMRQDRELKKINVVMLTAHNKAGYVDKAIAAGALGYIIKPFDLSVVSTRIRGYLARSAAPTSAAKS